MNRERAETHLRLVAEEELRRATARGGAGVPPDASAAGHEALVARQRAAVAAALYDLPRNQREVIALQYYGNLSETETSLAVGLSRGAVLAHTAGAAIPLGQVIGVRGGDEAGTWYTMGFSGRRGRRATELAGELTLDPVPPPGIRWLELTTSPASGPRAST